MLQEWGRPELAAGEHDLDDPAVIAWYRLQVYGPLPGQPGERDYFVMEIRAYRNRHRAAVYWDPVQSRYSNLAVTQLRTQRQMWTLTSGAANAETWSLNTRPHGLVGVADGADSSC